jgi:NOL1/NOP2/sun family putative RNA methylase
VGELKIQNSLPSAFVDRMRVRLGKEAEALFAAIHKPPETGLRVNLLKLRPEHLQRLFGSDFDAVPWCSYGFYVDPALRLGRHPYHAAGLYYLQEPSAMAVVEALQVQPGLRVLDLAAAPGGKTTQIAALMEGEGLLIANEVEGSRIKALGENLERWGARNVVVTSDTPDRLADQLGPAFDRVLLDAPCSGEGMFRKNEAARDEWSVEHVVGCAIRQGRILDQAARLVKGGGLLLYSTCTFAPEENEARIAAFLRDHPDWHLVALHRHDGVEPGRADWVDPPEPDLSKTIRLWPHRLRGEGHFVALLRNGAAPDRVFRPAAVVERVVDRVRRRPDRVPRAGEEQAVLDAWTAFARETLAYDLPDGQLVVRGDHVWLQPRDLPNLGNVRVVRSGLWLGTAKPGRFEPSHALALALQPGDARSELKLHVDGAHRYLRGETLPHDGPDGWTLVTIDGWPLGWGRSVRGVVKNFYPKGLRWSH